MTAQKTVAGHRPIRSYSYRDSGVDIDSGLRLVERLKLLAGKTRRRGADATLSGFGGLFDLAAAGDWSAPLLVAAADGVGTKLMVANAVGCHNGIGIDLVAMCVNDLVVHGAEPLFFLDYFATGELSVDAGNIVVSGIANGCSVAGCTLIGGETAEMPGFYPAGHYDLAGFAVGIVERKNRLPKQDNINVGDVVIGLKSSGVHANGFSLVRKIVADRGIAYVEPAPFDHSRSLGSALLEPSRIYVRPVLQSLKVGEVKALAHITGGGLIENIPRVLPPSLGVRIDLESWSMPPVFEWIAGNGDVEQGEMLRTFNCGIGMIVIASKNDADAVVTSFADANVDARLIGEVCSQPGVSFDGQLMAKKCVSLPS